jgi:hypothetical protein
VAFEFPKWCERCHADVDRGIWHLADGFLASEPRSTQCFTAKLRAALGKAGDILLDGSPDTGCVLLLVWNHSPEVMFDSSSPSPRSCRW